MQFVEAMRRELLRAAAEQRKLLAPAHRSTADRTASDAQRLLAKRPPPAHPAARASDAAKAAVHSGGGCVFETFAAAMRSFASSGRSGTVAPRRPNCARSGTRANSGDAVAFADAVFDDGRAADDDASQQPPPLGPARARPCSRRRTRTTRTTGPEPVTTADARAAARTGRSRRGRAKSPRPRRRSTPPPGDACATRSAATRWSRPPSSKASWTSRRRHRRERLGPERVHGFRGARRRAAPAAPRARARAARAFPSEKRGFARDRRCRPRRRGARAEPRAARGRPHRVRGRRARRAR